MGRVALVPATADHARSLAPRLRLMDRLEVEQMSRQTSVEALVHGICASRWSATALVDDMPVSMFGVKASDVLSGIGVAWMLGSEECSAHKFTMVRVGCRAVREMLEAFPVLVNYVPATYARSLAWARSIGFTVGPVQNRTGLPPFHIVTASRRA